ncbi:uncharacterized protein LOC127375991 [Dicentrarchus labrax]|uniref:uncharacterized protein LOC127375991 n=1 Tax=Dicentrarchus labrax TaxID=13489 RepID=UPI0021F61971|nr:uncharacterized protein LOC127375991 [Dicentrarchus labrax]
MCDSPACELGLMDCCGPCLFSNHCFCLIRRPLDLMPVPRNLWFYLQPSTTFKEESIIPLSPEPLDLMPVPRNLWFYLQPSTTFKEESIIPLSPEPLDLMPVPRNLWFYLQPSTTFKEESIIPLSPEVDILHDDSQECENNFTACVPEMRLVIVVCSIKAVLETNQEAYWIHQTKLHLRDTLVYLIGSKNGKMNWIEDEQGLQDVLSKCGVIKSGKPIGITCHYAGKVFFETLLRDLYETTGIKTKLHLSDILVLVCQTGENITQEISTEGLQSQNKDDRKKVVVTLDRNVPDTDSWPQNPQRFISEEVFENFEHPDGVRSACDELEALSWGFFHTDLPLPQKIDINSMQQRYIIGEKNGKKMNWIEDEQGLQDVLSKCYDIKSGKDIIRIIRHYAKTGESKFTYLMVKEWIYIVDPTSLYVYPVGKKLDNNEIKNIKKVKKCIIDQIGKERYSDMHSQFKTDKAKIHFAEYVKRIFLGEHHYIHPPTEAWYTTYFTASVISESARNFRTFPLILMALDMIESSDNIIREKGLKFLFEEHSMACGGTWIDTKRRGFSGSAKIQASSQLLKLKSVIRKELGLYQSWKKMPENVDNVKSISNMLIKYKLTESDSVKPFVDEYKKLKESSKT